MSKELSIQLANSLLNFQHRRRNFAKNLGAGDSEATPRISFISESLLRSIHENDNYNVTALAQTIHLERSWVSRVVVSLEDDGYIASHPDERDKRNKILRITEQGIELIKDINIFTDRVIKNMLSSLNEKEIEAFSRTLHQFTDALDAPGRGNKLHGDNIHYNLNRLSRLMGIFGEEVLGIELTLIELYIYWRLHQLGATNLMILDQQIPYDSSSISRTLNNLEELGDIRKAKSATDARIFNISLTDKGLKRRNEIAERFSFYFTPGINKLGESAISNLITLVNKALLSDTSNSAEQHLSILPVDLKNNKFAQKKQLKQLNIAPTNSATSNFQILSDNKLKASIEIAHCIKSPAKFNISIKGENLSEAELDEVFKHLKKLV